MTGMEIVRQEAARLWRGMIPATLIAFGVFALLGYGGVKTAVSMLLGAVYAMLLFSMMGRSAVKALLFPPAQGSKLMRRGYATRYVLTGCMVMLALHAPWMNPAAAILPLFFPKIILLATSIFARKEDKK